MINIIKKHLFTLRFLISVVKFEEESDIEDHQSDPDFRVKPETMEEERQVTKLLSGSLVSGQP